MPVSLPSVRAGSHHRTVTLGELRELLAAAEHLPDETIVRGSAIPFKMDDLGHPGGGCLLSIALDHPPPPQSHSRR